LKWPDVLDIAIALSEKHPGVDPKVIRFVELHNFVIALEGFNDDHHRGGEKVLEAIQAAWIAELE
jgi:FeS assembly protein IscX